MIKQLHRLNGLGEEDSILNGNWREGTTIKFISEKEQLEEDYRGIHTVKRDGQLIKVYNPNDFHRYIDATIRNFKFVKGAMV